MESEVFPRLAVIETDQCSAAEHMKTNTVYIGPNTNGTTGIVVAHGNSCYNSMAEICELEFVCSNASPDEVEAFQNACCELLAAKKDITAQAILEAVRGSAA